MPGRGIAKAGGCYVHFPQGMASKEHDFHALLRVMIHMVHLTPILAATCPPVICPPLVPLFILARLPGGKECFVLTLNSVTLVSRMVEHLFRFFSVHLHLRK